MAQVASISVTNFFVKLLTALVALVLVLLLALPIGFYGMAMYIAPSLPSINELKSVQLIMPLQVYTQDDKLVGQYGSDMSLPITYEEVPQNLVNAFLAAEDKTFFEHNGISVKGIGRALTQAASGDEEQTGGSTITMQVAKNYFLSSERTISRKLTEIFLARKIEEQLSKKDIMTLYVNKIYLGQGAYGIKAAAKQYYSKSLDHLTIAEMAMLAGLPKAPSKYNPVANPQRAIERRNWILGNMRDMGSITQAQYDEAIKAPINLHLYQAKLDANFPYLAEMARVALVNQYGENVMNSGWRVRLTINSEAQEIAERAIKRGLFAYDRRHGWRGAEANAKEANLANFKAYGSLYPVQVTKVGAGRGFEAKMQDGSIINVPWSGMSWAVYHHRNENSMYVSNNIVNVGDIVHVSPNTDGTSWNLVQVPKIEGSLLSLDPDTGALKAAVGGFDFDKSKFNRAIQGYRQPGSTIKPLVYSAALEKGFSPDTLISDGPLKIGSWEPKNSGGSNLGMIPLRKGLYLSRNLVSIRVLKSTGIPQTRELLGQFGLNKDQMPTTLSLALGSGDATPLQMATGYAAITNGGHRIQPYFIQDIFDYNNELIYQANPLQACAICFNQNLAKTNKQLLATYEENKKLEEAKKQALLNGEASVQTDEKTKDDLLNEDPLAQNKAEEALAKAKEKAEKEQQAKDKAEKEKLAKDKTKKDGKDDKTSDKKAVSEEDIAKQNQATAARMAALQAQLYNAGPETDRLQAPPTQYVMAQQAPRILSPNTAYQMANILRDVIQKGTATKAKALGRSDLGGKTGTTNDAKDAWFAGIHPTMVTTVWMGFDQPAPMGVREFGGVAALPVWMDFTGKMLKGIPVQWVSVNNRAKSKKAEQETLEITDDGERRVDSKGREIKPKDGKTKNSAKQPEEQPVDESKPPQASIQKRPEEPAEPAIDPNGVIVANTSYVEATNQTKRPVATSQ